MYLKFSTFDYLLFFWGGHCTSCVCCVYVHTFFLHFLNQNCIVKYLFHINLLVLFRHKIHALSLFVKPFIPQIMWLRWVPLALATSSIENMKKLNSIPGHLFQSLPWGCSLQICPACACTSQTFLLPCLFLGSMSAPFPSPDFPGHNQSLSAPACPSVKKLQLFICSWWWVNTYLVLRPNFFHPDITVVRLAFPRLPLVSHDAPSMYHL